MCLRPWCCLRLLVWCKRLCPWLLGSRAAGVARVTVPAAVVLLAAAGMVQVAAPVAARLKGCLRLLVWCKRLCTWLLGSRAAGVARVTAPVAARLKGCFRLLV
jgi:hypothetical protein